MSERNEPTNWHGLSPDLQERILLSLPVSSAVKAAAVCKSWRYTMASPSFSTQLSLGRGRRPWFFLWGINELIHARSAAFGFDPIAGRWFRLRTLRPPDFNRASLGGTNGAFFAFCGSRLCFTQTPTKFTWRETSPALHSRCFALLGTIGRPSSSSFKFVALGGILDDGGDRTLEIYDSCSDTWEAHDSLPEGVFQDGISSDWMSSAIIGSKFYVSNYEGYIADFDTDAKAWSKVQKLSIAGLESLSIVAGDAELYALCICRGSKGESLKLFHVDVLGMDCTEVSEMPHDLFSLFEDMDEQKGASLKCAGSGGLVYIYTEQCYKGYPVCMCDLTGASFVWRKLPSLPSPPRFDRVVCCSTVIFPQECLQVS